MPLYSYKAVNTQGEIEHGQSHASNQQAMLEQLQQKGWIPLEIHKQGEQKFLGIRFSDAAIKLSDKDILVFTDELATLLSSGLPLDRSLRILMDLTQDNKILNRIIGQVLHDVKSGASLADALERQPGLFGRFYLNMIRAGETGGDLAEVLKRLAVYLEQNQALKNSVATALIYPAILLIMSLSSLFVMLTFVVPQFSEMFESAGKALPLPTQIVVALADFLQRWWGALLFFLVAMGVYFRQQWTDPEQKKIWDARFLKWPLLGEILVQKEMANLSRTLGTLLGNGVSMLKALSIVRETVSNSAVADTLDTALLHLKQGKSLSAALAESAFFPQLAVQMIRMGEESGRLDEMLLRLADNYDKHLRTAIERMLALLEPALIIILGLLC
ncbi:type II secretion system F family protein [methane-oxidizing endosymbiont of Gigantopelta aegis]|uniref:type II secretion system F family protein n=1 Tax=methane-oxidizing endosymbiont of Gigantopelta aegis TaxID=2794938 RepID=UPI0018DEA02B|nr:type II secretion system F family protein [methane-oxidizing endosymbiont of Gigantopelta aegis]